jgi:formylglycine-generating enzyme required for sulfatase activity
MLDAAGTAFPVQQPCADCADLDGASNRSIRGGSWPEDQSYMPAARRVEDPPESVWYNVGIRCARSP